MCRNLRLACFQEAEDGLSVMPGSRRQNGTARGLQMLTRLPHLTNSSLGGLLEAQDHVGTSQRSGSGTHSFLSTEVFIETTTCSVVTIGEQDRPNKAAS